MIMKGINISKELSLDQLVVLVRVQQFCVLGLSSPLYEKDRLTCPQIKRDENLA